jgi:hypothetical protein
MTTIYTFKAVYKKDGAGYAPTPAPTITIVDADDNVLATAQATTALANMVGAYVYEYTGANDLDPIGRFLTADATVDEADLYSYTPSRIYRLDASISSVLTAIAGIPALVWSVASRTLTMTAAQVLAALTGSILTITNRVTFSQEISNLTIPATWSKIFVTFKKSRDYPDAASALQWVVSNPAAASTDGIAVYAGNPGGTSRTLGALTVDQPGGKITIGLQDDIDLALLAGDYEYDIKCLLADGSSVILTEAQGVIKLAVTRAV